VLFEILSWSR